MFKSKPSMIHHFLCAFQSLLLVALLPAVSLAVPGSDRTMPDKQTILDKLPGIRIPFIENRGQVGDARVSYYARTFGGTLFVTKSGEMIYSLPYREKSDINQRDSLGNTDERNEKIVKASTVQGVILRETLVGAAVKSIQGKEASSSKVSYYQGNESSRWHADLGTYETISMGEIYPGIALDLKAYGNNVEKLFTVRPHGDPGLIRMRIEGAKTIRITENGKLEVITDLGPVRFTKPVAYQEIGGKRIDVPVRYALSQGASDYAFTVSDYDRNHKLVIDPLLASTLLGGSDKDEAYTLALDPAGNVYVAGCTKSTNFPTTNIYGTSVYTSNNGNIDVFITKLSGDLKNVLASTYLGGSADEIAFAMILDTAGNNIYVAGYTYSSNFPIMNVYGTSYNTSFKGIRDVFIAKLSNDLSTLRASTYLGGSKADAAYSLALDASENLYVAGNTYSDDFPINGGLGIPFHYGGYGTVYDDVFIAKLSNDLTTLLASTYLGGSGIDRAMAIASSTGSVYVTGITKSTDFPTKDAYDTEPKTGSDDDIFISKLSSDLSILVASTLLRGNDSDVAYSMVLDAAGDVYVAGNTKSSNFPTTNIYGTSVYTSNNGNIDVFIAKMNGNLKTLLASTYLGGSGADTEPYLALDKLEKNVFVTGYTKSADFPIPNKKGSYDASLNGGDGFISKLNGNLTQHLASTFLGGSSDDSTYAIVIDDASRNVYVTGATFSTDFPTTSEAYDRSLNGYQDVFVSKFDRTLRKLDPRGDVDRNDIVNIADAILALQVLSGVTPPAGTIITLDADVNNESNDVRIDLAEVIYILQKVAGIRQ